MGDGRSFVVVVSGRLLYEAVAGGGLDEGDADGAADFAELDDFFLG